jgi:hypothetical protein
VWATGYGHEYQAIYCIEASPYGLYGTLIAYTTLQRYIDMLELKDIDLTQDTAAGLFVKDEIVDVVFARAAGDLLSRVGLNRFEAGDALITGSTGDRWSVSRNRFDAKYLPVEPLQAGEDGRYRARQVPVLARQMHEAFTLARSSGGDVLHGLARDWVLQYAPGDFGVAENARFQAVYRAIDKA